MNAYEAASDLVKEAERIDSARRINARHMARLLRNHLRHCDISDLVELKKQLRDFNMATGSWKP